MKMGVRDRFILRVTLGYTVLALAWILFSDHLLMAFTDIEALVWLSTAKGSFFVVATAIALFFVLRATPAADESATTSALDLMTRSLSPGGHPRWMTLLFTVAISSVALLLHQKLALGTGQGFLIMLVFPIILSALLGGLVPGLVSTAIVALGADYLVIPPLHSLRISAGYDLLRWAFLVISGIAVSLLSEALRRSRSKIESDHKLLEAIVSSTTDAIFVKDKQSRYLFVNNAAAALMGKDRRDIVGRDDFFLFAEDMARRLRDMDERVMTSGQVQTHEGSFHMPDGREMGFLISKGPLFDETGKLVGMFGISRDITGRRRMARALEENEAALREAQRLAQIGNWTWNIQTDEYVWSEEIYRIYGRDPSLPAAIYSEAQQYFTPESWLRMAAAAERAVTDGVAYEHDIEVVRPDGEHRWTVSRGQSVRNENGDVVRLHGTVQDITARKKIELALQDNALVLAEAQRLAQLGNWVRNLETGEQIWSDEIYRIYGRDPSLPPMSYEESSHFFTPESWSKVEAAIEKSLKDGTPFTCDAAFQHPDGNLRWVVLRGNVTRSAEGKITKLYGTIQDITERKRAEEAIRRNEKRLNLVLDATSDGIWDLDFRNGEAYLSPNYFALVETEPDGHLHTPDTFKTTIHSDDQVRVLRAVEEHMLGVTTHSIELDYRLARSSQQAKWLRVRGRAVERDADGKALRMVGSVADITERKRAEEQLRNLAQAVEQSPESIVITDLEARIEYVNESFLRTSGYSREELIGRNPSLLKSGETPQASYQSLWKSLTTGQTWQGEFSNRRKDGSIYTEHAIVSPIRQDDGHVAHYVAVKEDVTEKKRSAAVIYRLANFDPLTELPNRMQLLERIAHSLSADRRTGHQGGMLLFNIDRFQTINDAGGQALGDALLQAVAKRLVHNLREEDTVARIAGDEFAILVNDLSADLSVAANHAFHVAEKIHVSLREPFHLGGENVALTASLGIALFPASLDDTPLDVLRRANTALHHSKLRGGQQTSFFETSLDEAAKQRFAIERELHTAIESNQLRVYLQPQVNAEGKSVGAEALVRWLHPERGLMPPGAFIPVAEESNLIIDIGVWVLTEVCRLLVREDVASHTIRLAVNISPRHFRQPGFVNQVKQILASTGADPTHLMLEVTEGMLIDNINDVIAKMNELTSMGMHFSLDDFGTGYSSLSYLKRLPIHEIKIDRTFVQDMTTDANDASLVETILSVAEHLHLQVVAEGVETAEQVAFLNQRGNVIHQGYYFGRPEPMDQWLEKWLRRS